MRISSAWQQQQSVNRMLDTQSSIADLQNQISSGKRITRPSDDPVGASQALQLQHADASNSQYQRNIQAATTRLNVEDSTLSSFTDLLSRVRTLVVQANNDTQTPETRASIAKEIHQRLQQAVSLANTSNGQGEYLFAGTRTLTEPFAQTPTGVTYAGDDGQRMVAAAAGMQVATGDSGASLFMNVPTGNGRFAVSAAAGNQGSLVAGTTSLTNASAWDNGNYSIVFSSATSYDVQDSGGNVIASGSYDPTKGGSVAFKGVQVALSGTPAVGDSIQVGPPSPQSVFDTIDTIATALESSSGANLHNTLNRQLENVDQAIGRVSDTRAKIGARLNALDQQNSVGSDLHVQFTEAKARIENVDYFSAISQLTLQNQSLQAAQLTYSKVQGSSLFDYLR